MKSNNIRLLREIKGYSQNYVAYRLKKSQAAFSRIENGKTILSDDLLEQISNVLEVPREKLVDESKGFLGINFSDTIKELMHILTENKNLLNEIELNQTKLLEELKRVLLKVVEKNKLKNK